MINEVLPNAIHDEMLPFKAFEVDLDHEDEDAGYQHISRQQYTRYSSSLAFFSISKVLLRSSCFRMSLA